MVTRQSIIQTVGSRTVTQETRVKLIVMVRIQAIPLIKQGTPIYYMYYIHNYLKLSGYTIHYDNQ